MQNKNIDKPRRRSTLRRTLGREFYIMKRKARWKLSGRRYVCRPDKDFDTSAFHSCITHRSMMLRPLKDVDMQLQRNKVTNLRLAIGRMDGAVLRPGETLSVWKLVGRPTRRKGYLDGLVIHNGQISRGVGGGLCQLGNLLYWMALHTDLDVTERWRHTFDVFPDVGRTVPFACGATLGYNYLDLKLTNNTPDTYLLRLWQDDTHLNGELLCSAPPRFAFEVYETDHSIQHQWWGGYTRHNRIWKRRTDLETGVSQEILCRRTTQ